MEVPNHNKLMLQWTLLRMDLYRLSKQHSLRVIKRCQPCSKIASSLPKQNNQCRWQLLKTNKSSSLNLHQCRKSSFEACLIGLKKDRLQISWTQSEITALISPSLKTNRTSTRVQYSQHVSSKTLFSHWQWQKLSLKKELTQNRQIRWTKHLFITLWEKVTLMLLIGWLNKGSTWTR